MTSDVTTPEEGPTMTKPFTPTTEQVRTGFATDPYLEYLDPITNHTRLGEQVFDRWLAAHDAEVKAAALREARDSMADLLECSGDTRWRQRLSAEADRIEKEAALG